MSIVLVVDDSAVDRRLIGGLLQKHGDLQILYANNGAEALDVVRQSTPNLVLTDLIMPELDGLELVATMVARYPLIPVILMTGKGSEEIAVQALKAGAASYVPKSQLADMLLETVHNVLEMAREEQTQAKLMNCMLRSDCTFELGNEGTMIPPLVNFLHRSVRAVGLCDEVSAIRVCVALEEALSNAIFHGNLELSSEVRDGDPDSYRRIIDQRKTAAPYQDRMVRVDVNVSRNEGRFVIRDQGRGFDPKNLPDPTEPGNLEKASGRGILLMRTFMDEVHFNEAGNEVTLIKRAK